MPKNNFYKSLLDNLYDGIYFVDRNRKITYWNNSAEKLTGFKKSEVLDSYCYDNILNHINDEGINLCEKGCPLLETLADGFQHEAEVYLHHKNGHRVPVLIRVSPIRDMDNKIVGAVEIFSDNSSLLSSRKVIEELNKMALLDPLTKIGNRRFIEMNLQAKINELRRYNRPFGLLFIDIDYFKKINDTHGHDIGDKVLLMVSQTLASNARPFDLVGRWGGEEFLAIIVNVNRDDLYSIANRLRLFVENSSFSLGPDVIQVTVSIGGALAETDDTMDKLLDRADKKMYQSKLSGRNCVSI